MSPSTPKRTEIDFLADQLERSFHGGAWHGPAVAEVLDGVDAASAAAKVLPAHSIWEMVHHLTVWCDIARQRMTGEGGSCCPPEELDWPSPAVASSAAWKVSKKALADAHRHLHAALLKLSDADLERPVAGSDPTLRGLIFGVLQHNTYHAGQIALLKKAARRSAA